MNQLFLVALLSASAAVALSAVCGSTEYFEYSFEPISVGPVKDEDFTSSKKRCGEKECDVIIMLNGKDRCKKTDHSDLLEGPANKNKVAGAEFTPNKVDFKVHNNWQLSDARNKPVKVEVCDADGAFQGRNDALIKVEKQSLETGCKEYEDRDSDEEHPWLIKYKICCRPIGGEESGDDSSSGGSRKGGSGSRGSSWHGSKGDQGIGTSTDKGRSGSFSGGTGGSGSDFGGSRSNGLDRDRGGSSASFGSKGDRGSIRDFGDEHEDGGFGGSQGGSTRSHTKGDFGGGRDSFGGGSRGSSTRSHTKGDFGGDKDSFGGGSRGSSTRSHTKGDFGGDRDSFGGGSRGGSTRSHTSGDFGGDRDSFGGGSTRGSSRGGSTRTTDWSSRDRNGGGSSSRGSFGGGGSSGSRYELKGDNMIGNYDNEIERALGKGPGTTREKLDRYKAKGGNVRDLLKGDLKDRYDRLFGGKGEQRDYSSSSRYESSLSSSGSSNRYDSDRYVGSAGTGDHDYGKWRSKYRS